MAIYHLSMSNVSRGRGSSSVASASYITGRRLHDDATGETYNYGRRQRVVATGTILPAGADPEWSDPEKLWNATERADKNRNARPAKKVVVALPREFDLATQQTVLEQFIREQLTAHGYAATWAIHDDDQGNPHAHILIANRLIQKNGKWGAKSKNSYKLDEHGEKIPVIDPKTGRQKLGARNRRMWQSVKMPHYLDTKAALTDMRAAWAEICNKHLSADQAIDHRSYAEQGIQELPTIHEGYAARRMVAAGHISDRCEINRQILESREIREVGTTDLVLLGQRAVTTPGGLRDACEAAALYSASSAKTLAAIVGYANLPSNYITAWRPPASQPLELSVPVRTLLAERLETPFEQSLMTAIVQAAVGLPPHGIAADDLAEAAESSGGRGIFNLICKVVRFIVTKMRELSERLKQPRKARTAEPAVPQPREVEISVPDTDDAGSGVEQPTRQAAAAEHKQPEQTRQAVPIPVRMRPTPEVERQRMLNEAQKRIEQTDIMPWMERHGLKAKPKRVRVGGRRFEALKMPGGSTIVVDGTHWMYADKAGLRGGGSLIQFALTFAEPYKDFDITGGAHWRRALRELAEELCPDVVRHLNQRPMTPEEIAAEDTLLHPERSAPVVTPQVQTRTDESRSSRQDDGWER